MQAEAAVGELLFEVLELGTGQDALIDEGGLHLIEAGGALDTARGGIDDFAGLLLAEGLDADIAVDEAVQGFFVAGVGELFPSLLEASLGDRANRGQQIDLLHAHIENQRVKITQLEATLLPRRLVNLVKKN